MPTLVFEGRNIEYNERPGSPQESFSGDIFRAKRTFDVSWPDRWFFIKFMLGNAFLSPNGKDIKRVLPHRYFASGAGQLIPTRPFMIATALEGVEGLGMQSGVLIDGANLSDTGYHVARIGIVYESVTYNVVEDAALGAFNESCLKRFITVFKQPTAEFLTLPQGAYKWVEMDPDRPTMVLYDRGELARQPPRYIPCGLRVVGSNGKIVAAQEVIMVHHRVPGIPLAANTHIGCVNKYDWTELRVKRGQLLLSNIEVKPYKWLTGKRLFDITFKFKFLDPDPEMSALHPLNPRGHNWFLQFFPIDTSSLDTSSVDALLGGRPEYKLITHNGFPPDWPDIPRQGKTVYNYKDMRELFTNYLPDFIVDP